MDDKPEFKLHSCNQNAFKNLIIINRSYAIIHCIAICFLVYYRASVLFGNLEYSVKHVIPWILVFVSELLLSFMWLLDQAFLWRPVSRTVFPERLPKDEKLPGIDVFICTADPNKEPTLGVMNTVLSALALDYPADKLHVYLSDDAGSPLTLLGMREALKFARFWLPFCRRYGVNTISPIAFFSGNEDEVNLLNTSEFLADRDIVKGKFEMFKERIKEATEAQLGQMSCSNSRDHAAHIELINEAVLQDEDVKMPLLVYVAREKRPSCPCHFKAGAINVLLRVSGIISNSPYMLMLDCDMYCNDPNSAKKAMCFHLDPNISPSLAFVQFPQKFHNLGVNDIYDNEIRFIFRLYLCGVDGLKGPFLCGTNFYIKRKALCGSNNNEVRDLKELKESFGDSIEFIKSLQQDNKPNPMDFSLLQTTKVLASCSYENGTKWGNEVGFVYYSLVEDFSTGFMLCCKGWSSVYLNPLRPQFLGSSPTNLNDLLIQMTRWCTGMVNIAISKYSPLIYGIPRISSVLQSMCYAKIAFSFFFYSVSLSCLATIPPLCLLLGIPLYPQVSSSFFYVYAFLFVSCLGRHLFEILFTNGSLRVMINEQRIWMIKSVTSYLYGSVDGIVKVLGVREATFLPTNKVEDEDQVKRYYQMGIFDFRTSTRLLAPLITLAILNMASFSVGVIRMIGNTSGEYFGQFFAQVFLSFYILAVNYPVIEGMFVRKDIGRVPPFVSLLSFIFAMMLWALGYLIFKAF